MERKSHNITDWVKVFVDSVLMYGDYILKDSNAANRHYENYIKALNHLNEYGDAGLSALANLLNDDRMVVRVMAASYLIHYSTDKALNVLNEAAKARDRAISMLAIITIRRWDLGWYLDPATGKEAVRQK